MTRPIHVVLPKEERSALLSIASQDIRPPTETIRWLIVREAIQRGLLGEVENSHEPLAQKTIQEEVASHAQAA